jgi:hypothetical protein
LRTLTKRISVTADDIAAGVPHDCSRCPVALAIYRETNRYTYVVPHEGYIYVNGQIASSVPSMLSWAELFDEGKPVQPLAFDLTYWEHP